jgi:pantoate--beta-alanine ligase
MQKATTIKVLVDAVKQWRRQGESVAFVPTMGNLHAGHIKLVTEAIKAADRVVVSIFVNPTQFGPGEDYKSYPRTEVEDEAKLKATGIDLLFLPTVEEVYQQKIKAVVSVPGLSTKLCGANRPGHFDGVATVVTKLFNMVQPDMAFFGEKDFQQLAVIRVLVQGLNIPIEIFGVVTEREADGLAMSSRNSYLTGQQRIIAPKLYRALCKARDDILSEKQPLRAVERQHQTYLEGLGFKVDYFSICSAKDLQQASEGENELVILVAAKLGKPRLIDNLICSR